MNEANERTDLNGSERMILNDSGHERTGLIERMKIFLIFLRKLLHE